MASDPLERHYEIVAQELMDGCVVPLLGSGVNRCNRGDHWEPGQNLPDGSELAEYLADKAFYPEGHDRKDLLRVSQYYEVVVGAARLYEHLHGVFDVPPECEPTPVHEFLARLPSISRERGKGYPLIVTTNYDDALERAFRKRDEEFDLLVYETVKTHSPGHRANGKDAGGIFLHITHDGDVHRITKPNKYEAVSLEDRTVIVKMHGAIDRNDRERDTYVIAEDNYIDYLTRSDSTFLPALVAQKLAESHFLFLGYSLRDWNLRVILNRIWGKQTLNYVSWAIQLEPEEIDQKLWQKRGVDIFDKSLEEYIAQLDQRLARRLAQESGAAV